MRAHRLITSGLLLAGLSACVGDPPGDEVRFTFGELDSAAETTAEDPDPGLTTGGLEPSPDSSSSDGEGDLPEDPQYPRPEPLEATGECPPGFFGPITYDLVGWVCIPGCSDDDPATCPSGLDGDAEGRCATNPLSSSEPCDQDTDCTAPGEHCGNIGMGQSGCLLPPSHCILRCDEGQACPEAMTCSPVAGICQYLP